MKFRTNKSHNKAFSSPYIRRAGRPRTPRTLSKRAKRKVFENRQKIFVIKYIKLIIRINYSLVLDF